MLPLLSRFAALSMIGTVLLSLLPNGSLKRTAAFTIGLFTLMCWTEGIAALLRIDWENPPSASPFISTSVSIDTAAELAADRIIFHQEGTP